MPYREGDVVIRVWRHGFVAPPDARDDQRRVGTVCRVEPSGSQYLVHFNDLGGCIVVWEDALRPAPPGTPGPRCGDDC